MLMWEKTWPEIDNLPKATPVIVPIAAMEQHGHHLPLFTDSMLLGEVVRRVNAELKDQILVLPLTWLGNSHHHLDFAGTISAVPRVYLDLLVGLIDNLLFHGFHRILLLNGHGGNDVPGKQAIFEIRQAYRKRSDLLLLFATYWNLGSRPWETMPSIQQREMGHACEWETSMMLRLAPHLVRSHNVPNVEPGDPFRPASRAWITKDRSEPGHIGNPSLASSEKGEVLFQSFSADCIQLIQRMIAWDGNSWEG